MKDANTRRTLLTGFLLAVLSLVLFVPAVQARDVSFTWTANSESVDGYRLYYKTGANGGIPYDGTGATEGNSPVDTGNVTSFTLHGLSDSVTYHFALTAFSGTEESGYSTKLTLPPPTGITATFSWLPNEETNLAGYKIHYSTTSGSYDTAIDAGNPVPVDNRIQAQVDSLIDGTTYYFAATAYDSYGTESDYSTEVTWTATAGTGGGSPPVATNSTTSTTEDKPVSSTVTASNDTDLPISYLVQQDVANGTLFLETGSGNFTYTPQENYSGTDSFTFLAHDNNGDSNIATVSITITPINDPPTADNAAITVSEDSSANGQLQAQDTDGDNLTYAVVAGPAQGALALNASGAFTYTPNTNATGADSFTFQASDEQATSNIATVSITITPINDSPVAQKGSLNAVFEQTTSGILLGSDPDGDALIYKLVSDPLQVVTITNFDTGAYTFTPVNGISSPYIFTFTVNDGTTESNTATVTVTLFESGTITDVFGDTLDSTRPGTLSDTFTRRNNDIYASAEQIITWSLSSTTPHQPTNTIIIKTDLSVLRKTIHITEAKLYLYQTSATGGITYNNSIHKIIGKNPIIDQVTGYNAYNGEPWTPVEPGTTQNDVPLGLADIDQPEDSITLDAQPGYKSWLVTDMVKDWISDPASNFGLLISGVSTTTETGRTFAASENLNNSIRPKLIIHYIKKPPKPSVISAKQIK